MKTLNIKTYTDPIGRPTCAINFQTGEVCQFMMTKKFGQECVCFFQSQERYAKLHRYDNDDGFLEPCIECPLWNEKKSEKTD